MRKQYMILKRLNLGSLWAVKCFVLLGILIICFLAIPSVSAETITPSPNTGLATNFTITIDSPAQGSVFTDTNVIISGRAAPLSLINIDITDDDLFNTNIQHQVLVHTLGTTTSDKDGNWIFSPQIKFELGKYVIHANFIDPKRGKIEAAAISVSVSNEFGKTENAIFWRNPQFWLLVIPVLLIIIFLVVWKRSHDKQKKVENNEDKVEATKEVVEQIGSEQKEQSDELQEGIELVKEKLIKAATDLIEEELQQDASPDQNDVKKAQPTVNTVPPNVLPNIPSIPSKLFLTALSKPFHSIGEGYGVKIILQDANGNPINATNDINIQLASDSPGCKFSQNAGNAWLDITSVIIPVGTNEKYFYIKDSISGLHTVNVSVISGGNLSPTSQGYSVIAGAV